MTTLKERIDVSVTLNTPVAPIAAFGISLFLVDDTQIPVDQRYIVVTEDDWDGFDSSSHAYKYSNVYFGQKRTPDQLIVGRLLEAASYPYRYSGPDLESTLATWQALTAGSFNLDNGTSDEDFTGLNFSSITAVSQVPTVIQAKLDAASTVTGFSCHIDLLGRLVFTAGGTTQSVTITNAASGTSMLVIMDIAGGAAVASVAAETAQESVQAIKDLGIAFYNINLRSSFTVAELTDFASWVEIQVNLVDFVYTDSDAISAVATTDLGYALEALGLDRSMVIYTENTDEYPDAAINGCVLPATEGTTAFTWEALKLVTDSGDSAPLTTTERGTLKTKGYCWLEEIEDNVILYDGITAGNEEKRIMLGKDWYEFTIQSRIFLNQLAVPLNAFDNDTMTALQKIIEEVSAEAVKRRIIKDTPAKPLSITLPDADDITDEVIATRKFTELEAFTAYINSAINDYKIVGVWSA